MKELIYKLTAVFVLSFLFLVTLNTEIRSHIRSVLISDYRVILAVAQADLDNSGQISQILKVKTREGLFLEVYGFQELKGIGRQPVLLSSARLPDKKDGYFNYSGDVTNLVIDDVDNDSKKEILATTFDNDLVAHLNVYRYKKGQKELELVKLN